MNKLARCATNIAVNDMKYIAWRETLGDWVTGVNDIQVLTR